MIEAQPGRFQEAMEEHEEELSGILGMEKISSAFKDCREALNPWEHGVAIL